MPAVLVVTREAAAGSAPSELEAVLGPERSAGVEALLLERAVRWGSEVAPGALFVLTAGDGGESGGDVAGARVVPGARVVRVDGTGLGERLAQGVARVLGASGGPVLVTWPELVCWRHEHASAALADLEAGCALSVGPLFDGGFYLLALGRPAPWLAGLPERAWTSTDAMALAFDAAARARVEVGLLRAERGLRRVDDVRAALADPLTDAELRALLAGP